VRKAQRDRQVRLKPTAPMRPRRAERPARMSGPLARNAQFICFTEHSSLATEAEGRRDEGSYGAARRPLTEYSSRSISGHLDRSHFCVSARVVRAGTTLKLGALTNFSRCPSRIGRPSLNSCQTCASGALERAGGRSPIVPRETISQRNRDTSTWVEKRPQGARCSAASRRMFLVKHCPTETALEASLSLPTWADLSQPKWPPHRNAPSIHLADGSS
jgi:hypothetical protein